MLVKNIFMELRARLRSCNVYIITNVNFRKDYNLKISIQSDCIVLNYCNKEELKRSDSLSSIESLSESSEDEDEDVMCVIPLQEYCNIIPNSLSCLKIVKNTVTFRILTEPKEGGNFYAEFLSPLAENNIKFDKLEVNIKSGEEVKIQCANCSNVISNDLIKFHRILELPSTNLDMSEWFCHGHSSNNVMMKPNKFDFLYRLSFFVIDNYLLSDKSKKFNANRSVYHCDRCLAWLGMKNKDTLKLYNSDVKILYNDVEQRVFSHKETVEDVRIDDFVHTIDTLTKEFNLGLQYTMMCKIVLECTISSSVKHYLLIWVMDKELQVLRNCADGTYLRTLKLESNLLTKLLFKTEETLNDEVESWLADPNVVTSEISKTMFCSGVRHLEHMSQYIPESFRFTNGYSVSYLKA